MAKSYLDHSKMSVEDKVKQRPTPLSLKGGEVFCQIIKYHSLSQSVSTYRGGVVRAHPAAIGVRESGLARARVSTSMAPRYTALNRNIFGRYNYYYR